MLVRGSRRTIAIMMGTCAVGAAGGILLGMGILGSASTQSLVGQLGSVQGRFSVQSLDAPSGGLWWQSMGEQLGRVAQSTVTNTFLSESSPDLVSQYYPAPPNPVPPSRIPSELNTSPNQRANPEQTANPNQRGNPEQTRVPEQSSEVTGDEGRSLQSPSAPETIPPSRFRAVEAQPFSNNSPNLTTQDRDADEIEAEIREIRGELIQLLGRLEVLEAQLDGRGEVSSRDLGSESPFTSSSDQTAPDPEGDSDSTSNPSFGRAREELEAVDGFVSVDPNDSSTQLRLGTQTISLPGDVLFAFNESEIQPEAAAMLEQVAGILEAMPSAHVQVAGHTDDVGEPEYNLVLSMARATAVQDFLQEVLPEEGQGFRWTTTGHGETLPVASNESEEGRQRNRRVDLIVTPQ